jgi:hypothetical protein
VVERVIEVKYAFKAAQNIQKRQKTGGLTNVLVLKSAKNAIFALKYLTKYNHETFFE